MRRLRFTLITALAAFVLLVPQAGTAAAVVCIEEIPFNPCCGPITILGKDYSFINC